MSGITYYEKLEKGSFGTVYRAHDSFTGKVAVKNVRKPLFPGSLTQTEVIALRHPNVVRHHRCFMIDDRNFAYVMELAANKDLFEYTTAKPLEAEAIRLTRELFAGLEYLHSNAIVHMDLKRENCLIMGQGRLAIADFDFARRRGTPLYGMIGTVESWAPEIAAASRDRQLVAGMPAEYAMDIWAAGIVVWELETGRLRQVRSPAECAALVNFADPFMPGSTALSKTVNAACRRDPAARVMRLGLEENDEHEDQRGDDNKCDGGIGSRSRSI